MRARVFRSTLRKKSPARVTISPLLSVPQHHHKSHNTFISAYNASHTEHKYKNTSGKKKVIMDEPTLMCALLLLRSHPHSSNEPTLMCALLLRSHPHSSNETTLMCALLLLRSHPHSSNETTLMCALLLLRSHPHNSNETTLMCALLLLRSHPHSSNETTLMCALLTRYTYGTWHAMLTPSSKHADFHKPLLQSLGVHNSYTEYLSQYLTNLMHKICFTISFISYLYMFRNTCAHHQEVKIALHSLLYHHTYSVMQF